MSSGTRLICNVNALHSPSMEQSPLSQQERPAQFKPKIATLYEALFQELFLLKPEVASLKGILDAVSADTLLHHQTASQQLFDRAIGHVETAEGPADTNALDTLGAFLDGVLRKKFTTPSADIMMILASLDDIDTHKYVSPTLGECRIDRTQFIQDSGASGDVTEALNLLGLLANYNKFEFQNPYRTRIEDFAGEEVMEAMVGGLAKCCDAARNAYVNVEDDRPAG
ncbi:hypothetical protein MRB53_041583 [Persea americana]|nr:hypothetical protein MRB53_041583 [Persea americana]